MTSIAWILLLACQPDAPFVLQVVDQQTGRGVPLVELETVNRIRFVTDSHGLAAISDPDLMGQQVHFTIRSHGYEAPADGFGIRGARFLLEPGGRGKVEIRRLNVAERLYRVTGAGLYRDTILAGETAPIRQPLLNARVLGSDSVQNARFGGRLLWFWGDTNWPAYPLGNFNTPGARSVLPSDGGLDPSVGIDLDYEIAPDTGFAAETARMPGDGPTWISGLTVLNDQGRDRLFCGYVKIKPPMTAYRRGLAEWDDVARRWKHDTELPVDSPALPDGHPFLHTVDGIEYVYFPTPYPVVRVPARVDCLRDLSTYESFTCLEPGATPEQAEVTRDDQGRAVFSWRRGSRPINPDAQQKLLKSGALRENEALFPLRDIETGDAVLAHGGSINWNDYRKRWVMIAVQSFGKPSFLGEVWYAEADSPLGPWAFARRVVTHDDYSFYNPKQHPYFDQQGGRFIYFEGTYTQTFSGNKNPTPRYDYNQVMYRLDLDDPRLILPVAFYRDGPRFRPGPALGPALRDREIAFFAPDRPAPGLVPITETTGADGSPRLVRGGDGPPLFYTPEHSPALAPLWEWTGPDGASHAYLLGDATGPARWRRADQPLAHVRTNPGLAVHPLDR